jgi:hypothetical protein
MGQSLRYNDCGVSLRAGAGLDRKVKREIVMQAFPRFHNLDEEVCDRHWTVSGWVVTSRVAGLLRLLDDSFSLPGVQSVCLYA